MKKLIYFSIISLLSVVFISCEYDNYDEPSILLQGQLSYNGENFMYDGNMNFDNTGLLVLYQKGYGKEDTGRSVYVNETGQFSQLIFPGEYWFTLKNNVYPFRVKELESLGTGLGYDSIYMNAKSNITQNFEVVPYYLISNYTLREESGNIVASFKVTKNPEITGDIPRVQRVRLFVGTASIVNSATTLSKSRVISITEEAEVEVTCPLEGSASYRSIYINNYRDYAFCRVALELNGISNYYLFSDTKKIEGLPVPE